MKIIFLLIFLLSCNVWSQCPGSEDSMSPIHHQSTFCDSELLLVLEAVEKIPPPTTLHSLPHVADAGIKSIFDVKVKKVLKNKVSFDVDAKKHQLISYNGGYFLSNPIWIKVGKEYLIGGNLGHSKNVVTLGPCDYRQVWRKVEKYWKKWFDKGGLKRDCSCKITLCDTPPNCTDIKGCVHASWTRCFRKGALCVKKRKKCRWQLTKEYKKCKKEE